MRQVAHVLLSPFYVQRANFFCPKPHVAVWGVLLPTRLKSGYTRETRSLLSQNLHSGRGRKGEANNKPKACRRILSEVIRERISEVTGANYSLKRKQLHRLIREGVQAMEKSLV